jgi:hypothetical protein
MNRNPQSRFCKLFWLAADCGPNSFGDDSDKRGPEIKFDRSYRLAYT